MTRKVSDPEWTRFTIEPSARAREPLMDELPIVYEIDRATQVVYVAVGPWTPISVRVWVEQLLSDRLYEPGMRGVLNLRFAAGPFPDDQVIRRIVEAMSALTKIPIRTRWAVLVSARSVAEHTRFMHMVTSAGYIEFKVFDEDVPALAWLGVGQPGGSS